MKFSKSLLHYFTVLRQNPLFAGSLVMVLGANFHNLGQLVYHFLSGRFLGTAYYGDLAAIISIFGLIAIVQQSFGLTVVKFIAAAKNKAEANTLARWVFFWSIWGAIVVAIIILILSSSLGEFLNITQKNALLLFIPIILVGFVSNTGRALLQGFMKFEQFVLSLIFEVVVKITFTILLLYIGYALFGAMAALFLGVLAGFLIVWLSLRKNIAGKRGQVPNITSLVAYSFPVLLQSLALTSMYSADLILVKHFFRPEQAGIYAALAKLGTIAFFGAAPITHVMFPLISKKYSHKEPYHKIFYLSIMLVCLISLPVIILYKLLPSLIVSLLFGGEFVEGAPLLWWFSVYMFLLGICMLFTQFYLSINKTKTVLLFVIAASLQVVLILLFHQSLLQVIQMSIVSAALLVFSLLIYFPYHHRS